MIDIDAIEEWNSYDLDGDAYEVQAIVSKGDLMDIITALRQSEKDAARYRWLRECTTEQSKFIIDNGHVVGFGVLDALIDEAMSVNQT